MAIRIDIKTEESEVVVCLAGRLFGDEATQLRNVCEPIEGVFVLDLSHLLYANDAGIEVIRAIGEQGMEIRGASPFIQLLIDNSLGQDVGAEEGYLT
jgi:anti-anti-sigma regulatory factor